MTAVVYLDHTEAGGPVGGSKKMHGRRKGSRTVVSASMEGDIRISEEKSRMLRSDDGRCCMHVLKFRSDANCIAVFAMIQALETSWTWCKSKSGVRILLRPLYCVWLLTM